MISRLPAAVRAFLSPKSVAIVGVSAREGPQFRAGGRAVLDHLVGYDYEGEVWPVHPTATRIGTTTAYPSLDRLPGVPDCVVVALPATAVLGVLEECAAIGARHVLVLTGGFSELGDEGAALERSLMTYATEHDLHLVGPNSTGIVSVPDKLAMSMTSVLTGGTPLRLGSLAIITQSGAIGSSIVERARDADVGISHLVSIGNQLDLDAADFLGYFATDPDVRAVAMYLESIRDGEALRGAMARMHASGKRAVVLLGGHSATGERAAASHTGKVLGRGALELALLRSLDVTIAEDLDDLWLLGDLFTAAQPVEPVTGWGIMTFSGGMGVLTVDRLADDDVVLTELSDGTISRLSEHLPAYVKPSNPLDIGPGAMPAEFGPMLRILADDEGVGGVCVPMPMGANGWHDTIVEAILQVAGSVPKPILVGWYGGAAVRERIRTLRSHGVVTVETPAELARVVRALSGSRASAVSTPPDPQTGADAPGAIGGFAALERLADAQVDVARMRLARDADEVVQAARELGYPVVVKSANEGVAHRLELGLVKVGIADEDELRTSVSQMQRSYAEHPAPDAPPLTFLLQEMVPSGHEVVLAVRQAGTLGWFASVGLGGSAIEVFGDVVHLPLPATPAVVRGAVARLHSRALWFGHRGIEGVDLAWVSQTLNRLGDLAARNGWLEVECNPAIVTGNGGRIVDALVVSGATPPVEPL